MFWKFWIRDQGSVSINGKDYSTPKLNPMIGPFFARCLVWFGIILPTLAILCESQFHLCARHFFDPFPSLTHTLLFSVVPIAGLLSWLCLGRNNTSHYGLALFANGMAVGIAILYTLMFVPLMPTSAALIPVLGFGLLGFAPLFSLMALWASGNSLQKNGEKFGGGFEAPQVKHAGHLVILATVLAVELPSTVTRVAMGMACKPETQEQGLNILRAFGNQEVMLRACYERSGRATDVLGSLYEVSHPADVDLMRNIFYKTTGRTFNSFPIPESARSTMSHMGTLQYDGMDQGADDEFDFDPDVAGEMVSGVSRGLSVSKSKMEATVDADAGVGQIDWYLDFNNKSKFDREVRTRIKLPHGAAINKASLIVNGKEFECQITLREEAREIYRAAVESKRNPLLVSTCGEDTVLVQCYPVPPGNNLQLHLGAVAPLALNKDMKGVLALPQFEERNFQINVPHAIALTSDHELSAKWGDFKSEKKGEKKFVFSGNIDAGALATGNGIISFERCKDAGCHAGAADAPNTFWCKDNFYGHYPIDFKGSRPVVSETIADIGLKKPEGLVVLVDLSICMKDQMKQVVEALRKLPPDMLVQITCVTDRGPESLSDKFLKASSPEFAESLKRLSERECVGGQIDQALSSIISNCDANSAVLWLHGAQPFGTPLQEYELNEFLHGKLYDMQIASGPDVFLDSATSSALVKVPRFGSCGDDLALLFEEWQKPGTMKTFSRKFAYAVAPISSTPAQAISDSDTSVNSGAAQLISGSVPQSVGAPGTRPGSPAPNREVLEAASSAPSPGSGTASSGISGSDPGSVDGSPAPTEELSAGPMPEPACSIDVGEPAPDAPPAPHCGPVGVSARSCFGGAGSVGASHGGCNSTSLDGSVKSNKVRGVETMTQLAQLYAAEQINSFIRQHNDYQALRLAAKYHLVTPVSSAVLVDTVPDLERMSRVATAYQVRPEEQFLKSMLSSFNFLTGQGQVCTMSCNDTAANPGCSAGGYGGSGGGFTTCEAEVNTCSPTAPPPQTVVSDDVSTSQSLNQEVFTAGESDNYQAGDEGGASASPFKRALEVEPPPVPDHVVGGALAGIPTGAAGVMSNRMKDTPGADASQYSQSAVRGRLFAQAPKMPTPAPSYRALSHRKATHDYSVGKKVANYYSQRGAQVMDDRPVVRDYKSAPADGAEYKRDFSSYAGVQKQEIAAKECEKAPMLSGATNGTAGPQGCDATVIQGVNTAGSVRLNRCEEVRSPAAYGACGAPSSGAAGGDPSCCRPLSCMMKPSAEPASNEIQNLRAPLVFSLPSPVTSYAQQNPEAGLYNANGEVNPLAVAQRFWFIILGLFVFVYSMVHQAVKKLGLS